MYQRFPRHKGVLHQSEGNLEGAGRVVGALLRGRHHPEAGGGGEEAQAGVRTPYT